MKQKMILFLLITLNVSLYAQKNCREVFTNIYNSHEWGTNQDNTGSSGSGSSIATTILYRDYLQKFLTTYNIKSVVDLGCGDWNFSQLIDWNGIFYLGIDVVDSVIEKNNSLFASENIQFQNLDALSGSLPSADLLICKDVLQHLPNAEILRLIPEFAKYKYCLITDNVDVIQNNVLYTSYQPVNQDIAQFGLCRPIDLTKEPFSAAGKVVLKYLSTAFIMQVLLIDNSQ